MEGAVDEPIWREGAARTSASRPSTRRAWSAGAGLTDAEGNYTIRGLPEGAGVTAEFRVAVSAASVKEW